MIRTSFDRGWTAGPALTAFDTIGSTLEHPEAFLPHDVVRDMPRSAVLSGGAATGYFPGGHFEYVKTFAVPHAWRDKTVLIEFEGVYRDAVIFVNDDFVTQRPHGYSGFTVELDAFLQYGADNTVRVECRAHQDSRWYAGAGIFRPTWLVVADTVHVPLDGVRVDTADVDHERAMVLVSTAVRNIARNTRTVRVTSRVVGADGSVVAISSAPVTVQPRCVERVRFRMRVPSPALWDIDTPHLYCLETSVSEADDILDEHRTTFGIRTLQLDAEHGLRINGSSVNLRGACIHSDNGLLGAAAIGRADERRVELLKDAGFNAIRSAHNPISRATLAACDRVGVVVMDELTDVWTRPKTPHDYSLAFPEWWERDVEAMVAKDMNHPSVILYSIGNEIFETGSAIGSSWGRRLAEKLRQLDSTRFVTNGINPMASVGNRIADVYGELAAQGTDINTLMSSTGDMFREVGASEFATDAIEESASVLDVLGLNYAESRYDVERKLYPDRVLVGSETFPAQIAELWRAVLDHTHVIGDFTWTGWDYLGEAGLGRTEHLDAAAPDPLLAGPYPWLAAWCGDIDITGHRRPASYYREIVYGLRAEPYIAVHRPHDLASATWDTPWSWTDSVASWSWDLRMGDPVVVDVYSPAEQVELHVNGRSVGKAAVGEHRALVARWEIPYESGELVAVAYVAGAEVGRTALRSADGPVRISAAADRSEVQLDSASLVYVTLELQDASGVVPCDRDQRITVDVEGPGLLAAVGSADPRTEERFGGDSCTTFDGRAQAIVRPTGTGTIAVRFRPDEGDAVAITVEVVQDDWSGGIGTP